MPKKILYIGNKLSKHGFSLQSIETLGPLLEQQGYSLLYASDKKNQLHRLLSMLASVVRHRKEVGVVLMDTYSSTAFYYSWASARLCRFFGIKYVPILRGGNMPERIAKSHRLTEQLFGNSFTNIIISDYLKKSVEGRGFKYLLIPNNIDLSLYNCLPRPTGSTKLLWVRAFHSVYNPQLAIRVLKKISTEYPEVTLTMVGPKKDESFELCKTLSAELGVQDKVTFTGKLSKEEWRGLSEQHAVFINTTNFDNLPISVLEAMALGMPVVTTNVGGIPFLMKHEVNGLLVEPDNETQMVDAIKRLIADNALTANLSTQARATASLYDWSKIKDQWNRLLRPLTIE